MNQQNDSENTETSPSREIKHPPRTRSNSVPCGSTHSRIQSLLIHNRDSLYQTPPKAIQALDRARSSIASYASIHPEAKATLNDIELAAIETEIFGRPLDQEIQSNQESINKTNENEPEIAKNACQDSMINKELVMKTSPLVEESSSTETVKKCFFFKPIKYFKQRMLKANFRRMPSRWRRW